MFNETHCKTSEINHRYSENEIVKYIILITVKLTYIINKEWLNKYGGNVKIDQIKINIKFNWRFVDIIHEIVKILQK